MSLLSVVVTTKNRPNVLKRCLEALFGSSQADAIKEVIVVDDGSDDGLTQRYLAALADACSITYIRNQCSRGPAFARNRGIERVRGAYTLLMGDDVIFACDAIEKFVQHIERYDLNNASMIGNIEPWDYNMTAFEWWCSNGGSQFTHYRITDAQKFDAGEEYFYTTNIVTPTRVLRDNPFNESFPYARYEDRELGYRLRRRINHKIHYLADARSIHMHKLQLREWLQKLDQFAWSALHFSKLYPDDEDLKVKLGIVKAMETEEFRFSLLADAVDLINRYHQRFFDGENKTEQAWVQNIVMSSLRDIQEFFRVNYYRRHMGLTPLEDRERTIDTETAMATILAELEERV